MDRQKKKRIRNTRVILTNIFMAITVVFIVFFLMFIAMGYNFSINTKQWQIEVAQSGLVEINSRPSGARVEIDGKARLERTRISSMLSSGDHDVRVTKNGYDVWQRKVNVDAGLLTNIDWVRLFPSDPIKEEVANFGDIRLHSYAPNRKSMIIIEDQSDQVSYIDLESEKSTITKFKLSTALGLKPAEALTGELKVIDWNNQANKIVLTHQLEDKISFYLLNLQEPSKSINLSEKFNLPFQDIRCANDSASKLWVIEDGKLHSLDVSTLSVSAIIASKVESFTHDGDVVIYVSLDDKDDQKRAIYVYRDGESGATKLKTIESKDTDHPAHIKLAAGTYWNENWLAYTVDSQLRVLFGSYPSFDKPSDAVLKKKVQFELSYIPDLISVNGSNRLLMLAKDQKCTSVDIQTHKVYPYQTETPLTSINWLDLYLTWQKVDDKIIVRDFDGNNRREIILNNHNNLGTLLSANDEYLYFFESSEKSVPVEKTSKTITKHKLVREQLKL